MALVKILGNAKFFGKTILGEVASSPTYAIGRSLSAVDEGSSVTFTLSTTNVANGTLVPYTISGISANDVTSGTLSGSFTVSNGLATATITMSADQLTEGAETATLTLNNAAASNFVVVNDTSVFTPNLISGLQLWLDAADSSTLFDATVGGSLVTADGAAVARWADKSGNNRHATQGTTNSRPLLRTNVKNGRNVLRFDGSNDWLQGDFPSVSVYSAFAVIKRNGSHSNPYNNVTFIWTIGRQGDGTINGLLTDFWYNNNGFNWSALSYSTPSSVLSQSPFNNNYNLFSMVAPLGTGAASFLINGANQQSVSVSSLSASVKNLPYIYRLGTISWNLDYYLNGDISEILIYNSALTTTQRQQVETYLNNKWALY
jgi:hypothetical protein